MSREMEKANRRFKAQRTTEARHSLYMKTFAKANPDLMVEEIVFYAKRDKEHRNKQDEKHAHRISTVVNELFNQLDWERRGRGETIY